MSGHRGEDTWTGDDPGPSAGIVAVRYEVLATLGQGAIGVVERVRDRHLDRTVARKRLLSDDPAARARFVREAQLTASLAHPGILPVYDVGEERGWPYYTTQEVHGHPWVDDLRDAGLEARLGQLDVLLAVARALAHAHGKGILHGDVKPHNVMIGELGGVWLVDWGLAVREDEAVGRVAGTPQYMAPEQARGEVADRRSDVWALGVVLYRILEGRAPWEGEDVLARVREATTLSPGPEAPPELAAIVRRACAAQPADRYADAEAFAADLWAYLRGQRVAAHRYTPGELAGLFLRRYRWPLAGAAGLVGMALVALTVTLVLTGRERDRAWSAEQRALGLLATALERRALAAPEEAWDPEAEEAAAQALTLGPSPDAMGVLARYAAAEHPRLQWRRPLPCPGLGARDGYVLWQCGSELFAASYDLESGELGDPVRLPLTLADGARPLAAVASGHGVLVWGEHRAWVRLRDGAILRDERIGRIHNVPLVWDGRVAHIVADQLSFLGEDQIERVVLPFSAHAVSGPDGGSFLLRRGQPWDEAVLRCSVADPSRCDTILVGPQHGALWRVGGIDLVEDTQRGILRASDGQLLAPTGAGGVAQFEASPDLLFVLTTSEELWVYGLDGRPVARMPGRGVRRLAWQEGRLITVGTEIASWDPGSRLAWQDVGPGRVASAGEGLLVVGVQGGTWSRPLGEVSVPIAEVVKAVDLDGAQAWVFGQSTVLSLDGVDVWEWTDAAGTFRGVADGQGGAWSMGYDRTMVHLRPGAEPDVRPGPCWGDLARAGTRVLCGNDHELRELRADGTSRVVAVFDQPLWGIAVHPREDWAVVAKEDRTLHRVDLSTGASEPLPSTHVAPIPVLAFSGDGRWLASGSWDTTIQILDLDSREVVAVLRGHEGRVIGLAFQGDTLWSTAWDGRLWAWGLAPLDEEPHELLARVRREAGLTPDGSMGHDGRAEVR